MSKRLVCESYLKEKVTFTYEFPFYLETVDGIHEVLGTISGIKSAFTVGEQYIDTAVEKRTIIISGIIRDNFIDNRQKLYRVFPLKSFGTLYYYEEHIERKISYQVQDVKVSEKGYPRKFQITLVCPTPYFTDINKTTLQMATWSPAFKFPLKISQSAGIKFGTKNKTSMATINNTSNIEFGLTIIFKANDTVVNPSLFNVESREEMKIEKTMNAGDQIIVTTLRDNEDIIYIPANSDDQVDINNLMAYGSKFLQVHHGLNTLRYNADENVNNLEAKIEYFNEYEAV